MAIDETITSFGMALYMTEGQVRYPPKLTLMNLRPHDPSWNDDELYLPRTLKKGLQILPHVRELTLDKCPLSCWTMGSQDLINCSNLTALESITILDQIPYKYTKDELVRFMKPTVKDLRLWGLKLREKV